MAEAQFYNTENDPRERENLYYVRAIYRDKDTIEMLETKLANEFGWFWNT